MEVLCKNCKAKFMIADNKLPTGQIVALKCPKCKSKIEVDTRPSVQGATPGSTPITTLDEMASDTLGASEKSFDFVEAGVETALICEQDAGVRKKIHSILEQMNYHVTEASSARDAMRYMRFRVFGVVVLDENFEGGSPESNHVLQYIGHLPMNTRRDMFVVLLGNHFTTADNMTAFNRSVNLVVNFKDIDDLGKVLKRSLIENENFYRVLRGTLRKVGRA
jgi:predicted Zn finger-like uncharacterized protein